MNQGSEDVTRFDTGEVEQVPLPRVGADWAGEPIMRSFDSEQPETSDVSSPSFAASAGAMRCSLPTGPGRAWNRWLCSKRLLNLRGMLGGSLVPVASGICGGVLGLALVLGARSRAEVPKLGSAEMAHVEKTTEFAPTEAKRARAPEGSGESALVVEKRAPSGAEEQFETLGAGAELALERLFRGDCFGALELMEREEGAAASRFRQLLERRCRGPRSLP